MLVAFPFRLVRIRAREVTPQECDAQQLAAYDRWSQLSPEQQYRRQRHRTFLLKVPLEFAGDAPPVETTPARLYRRIDQARGRFLARLDL